ncbi:YdeI family protein [Algoriphagus sp. Y33]|uniref:YdeI/OmpD-associated family protein n=1 Tax=Algoriphagus sp. Y33 TaxID=2772483 RepID=UPI00177AA3C1|nr:YdeI/OmpD-associated family protein [Algoriphagus sp. Y33]
MNTNVDLYFTEGCGRCPLGGTSDCKVNFWTKELHLLRKIILDCGLVEESKWGVPCYTFRKKNVLVLAAMKEYCTVSFFKGALLQDVHNILSKPGDNTQAARLIKFTTSTDITLLKTILKSHIYEAIEVEKAGLKVEFIKNPEPIPEELQAKLDENHSFKKAFEALTPGRQRGYILYFTAPKQTQTRVTRIEKCTPKILEGKGLNDR